MSETGDEAGRLSRPETRAAVESRYRQRLEARRGGYARDATVERWVSGSRLALVVIGLVLAWLAIQDRVISAWWIALPVGAFAVLLVVHERVLRRRAQSERAVAFYSEGLQRLRGQWIGRDPEAKGLGERYSDAHHAYCDDLDLFGPGSVFELLNRARTRFGEDELAGWLLAPAEPDQIRRRQAAVQELSAGLEFRESLYTLGTELRSELDPQQLIRWAEEPPRLRSFGWLTFVAPLIAAANITAIVGWALWEWGSTPLLALLLVESASALFLRQRIGQVLKDVGRAERDLELLGATLELIEGADWSCDWLSERQQSLEASGASPGLEIARLRRLVDLVESRRNAFFAPIGALLLWTTQLALRIDRWRERCGHGVVDWLAVVAQVEAAASLASHAFENPEDQFPELLVREAPLLEGDDLGHPLLPVDECVTNSIRFDRELGPQAYVVSGSNMSGKSTFLRTCGVNVVLAQAGAPVRGSRMRLTPLDVGASIRVQDSLMEGSSRFYAEILQLRGVLDVAAGARPCFFLLDEILHGTNSHDRRIGASAVVRTLLDRGAIGLVTTHDLALAEMAKDDERLRNVHFVDHLEEGKVTFDYRLHEGVVTKSNALDLMREVGLEV